MVNDPISWLPAPAVRQIGEGELRTYVSVPADGRRPSGGWPGLVFLHGKGESADQKTMSEAFLDTDTAHGPLRRVESGLERRLRQTFVIATPQLPGMGGDVWDDHSSDVEALVSQLLEQDGVDELRLSLCGFSYGGNGVIRLASLRHWHAVWVVDPPMVPPRDPLSNADIYRFAFGKYSTQREEDWLDVLPADRRVIVHYGDQHGPASWHDFGNGASYDGLDS